MFLLAIPIIPRTKTTTTTTDFILQPQITIIKTGTPSDLEGRPSLYAGSWRDV